MSADLQPIFDALRAILQRNAQGLRVSVDTPNHYSLDAAPGPATMQAWGGQLRRSRIPVAWVEIQKNYVSYHLMTLGDPKIRGAMSSQLNARMQGKTCFNFTINDPDLFKELDALTARSVAAFRDAGFIGDRESA